LRAGITTVMLPARNERDLEDIPADARAQVTFVWLQQVDDALAVALEPVAVPGRSGPGLSRALRSRPSRRWVRR
jgi:ATP-dependent Lon protease